MLQKIIGEVTPDTYLLIGTIIASVATTIAFMKGDIRMVKQEIAYIKSTLSTMTLAFQQVGEILTKVAVQDNRIDRVEQDIREIKHGKGFVTD
jgi:hypothetical protein